MEDDSTDTCVLDERWILRNFINDQVLEKLQLKMVGIIIKLNELWKLIWRECQIVNIPTYGLSLTIQLIGVF